MRTDAGPFSIDKVLRQAVVVPESKRVDRLLKNSALNATIWLSLSMSLVVFLV